MRNFSIAGAMLCALAPACYAVTTKTVKLEEVIVTSTRLERDILLSPTAVSSVGEQDIQLGRQQLGIDESLSRVPGVFFQNRYNFNQELRVSIRGFGARAQFGINGIRMAVDDIPITTPDGTTAISDIDIGSMGRIEVIRGPSAALFGTASGGAISIYTEDAPEQAYVDVRATTGEYSTNRYQVKAGGRVGNLGALVSVARRDVDGYRDFSETEATTFNTKFTYDFDETFDATAVFAGVDVPLAQDPGALTANDLRNGPRTQARTLNVNCNTREIVDQYRGGLVLRKRFDGGHSVRVRGYGLTRDFDANLPCPFVGHTAFDRSYYGGGAEYGWSGDLFGRPNRFIAGVEITTQEDDRLRFDSSGTGVRGPVTEQALEGVDTWGIYFQNELLLTDTLAFTVSGRFESLEFDLQDRFLGDGDDSASTEFEEFTPMAGIVWSPRDWVNLYANISTSFETPTLNQLDNPAGAGFNPAVDAQTSTNYEIGAKGRVGDRIRYEAAFFTIDLQDELVPFDIGGDTFFRNAGESTRAGMELAGEFLVFDGLTATVAYTLNDFEYDRYTANGMVFDGNDIPGLPEATFFAELAYRSQAGWYAIWDILHVGDMFANDDNSVASRVDSYRVSSLRFGRDFQLQQVAVSPFFGVNNLFEEEYFGNVRINQGFNRYFEPAPERNVYGGVNVRYTFGR